SSRRRHTRFSRDWSSDVCSSDLALNQVDTAAGLGLRIDSVELAMQLQAQVVETVATKGQGIDLLRRAIERAVELPIPSRRFTLPEPVREALQPVEAVLLRAGFHPSTAGMEALRLMAVSPEGHLESVDGLHEEVERARRELEDQGYLTRAIEAELRYGWIAEVVQAT